MHVAVDVFNLLKQINLAPSLYPSTDITSTRYEQSTTIHHMKSSMHNQQLY